MELKEVLKRNKYPDKIIDNEIKKYLNNIFENSKDKETSTNKNFYKLPYFGTNCKQTQKSINILCKELCKETNITIIFIVSKIKSFFPTKSKALPGLRSFVVYKYICPSCGASYIGETTRHWLTRVKEHLSSSKTSHIYQHIHSNNLCKGKSNETNFSIIDKASTEFTLKIKEALHIKWDKPNLNKQIKHINLTLDI